MSSSRKKAIVRKLNREWLAGYLPPSGFDAGEQIEFLDLLGNAFSITNQDVKWICFVRDFNSGELNNPERLLRKAFAGRPRGEGIWVRLRLKDGDALEGLAENDLNLVHGCGLFLVPPDMRGNTQRVWVPRCSIAEFAVLAVLGGAQNRKRDPKPAAAPQQETLFGPGQY